MENEIRKKELLKLKYDVVIQRYSEKIKII